MPDAPSPRRSLHRQDDHARQRSAGLRPASRPARAAKLHIARSARTPAFQSTAPSLFAAPLRSAAPNVPGLHYFPDFLDRDAQARACAAIDAAPWRDDLTRRVQHYGWRYDYQARTITRDMRIGPLPDWLHGMSRHLVERTGLFDAVPGQVIVNEYLPGQGIAMHVDRECFGPAVATVSLADDWLMDLRPADPSRGGAESMLLGRGSALVLTGEARQSWLHGIPKRKRDRIGGTWRKRQRRLSLTFRTVPDGAPG